MKVQKLPSGSYRAVVAAGYNENGKRIYKSFTAKTEWEAIKMAEDFKQTREELTDKNVTVHKAMEMYIESRANVIELTTIRGYRQIAKHVSSVFMIRNFLLCVLWIFKGRSIWRVQGSVRNMSRMPMAF